MSGRASRAQPVPIFPPSGGQCRTAACHFRGLDFNLDATPGRARPIARIVVPCRDARSTSFRQNPFRRDTDPARNPRAVMAAARQLQSTVHRSPLQLVPRLLCAVAVSLVIPHLTECEAYRPSITRTTALRDRSALREGRLQLTECPSRHSRIIIGTKNAQRLPNIQIRRRPTDFKFGTHAHCPHAAVAGRTPLPGTPVVESVPPKVRHVRNANALHPV